MKHPGTSYTTFMVVAAFAGFGGGNFASSMTNINAFYPQRLKGWALGLNAGGGNIGVPVIQLVGLLVIATVGNTAPEIVCAIYLVADRAARPSAPRCSWTTCATSGPTIGAMAEALRLRALLGDELPLHRHVRLVHRLLASRSARCCRSTSSPAATPPRRPRCTPRRSRSSARCSARSPGRSAASWPTAIGGGRITLYTFVAMIFAAGILVGTGMIDDGTAGAPTGGQMTGYVVGFHPAVHPVGHRQRLDVQDDPVDLRGQGAGPRRLEPATRRPRGRAACPAR